MKRELTALVAGPVTVWIVGWAHPYVFDVAIAMVAALALYEFLDLGTHKGYDLPVPLCIGIMLFIVAAFILESVSVEMGLFLALLLIPASYVVSRGELEEALPSSAIAILATLYVGMLGGSIIRLHNDFADGAKLVFFLLLVVWLGDAGAYYFGRTFGKHKLSPRISPKKTVEGLIGGVITAVATALIIHFTFFHNFPLIHTIIAGSILSVAGVVGDLAESMWKRSADVKDSGTLIPGHGGFLDRFDSIFYTAPILYAYWFLIMHEFKSFKIMSA
ncbi:MAG: phosphatidate cytidylyltransferase [Thermoanaerobaculia bacterium]|jgi:phosphatidate cytidylyltransferase|nr:phosphatidate cytidylyltransferase [Thermoanaerobaculia bacterium]